MKVLLLSPPYLEGYMRNARCDFVSLSGSQWYPLLMGYCGAWLEKQGHDVRLIDAPTYGLSHDETRRMVREWKPDWLVVYTGRMSEENDVALADELTTALDCSSVLVGAYASINPRQTLARARVVPWLVSGEFEHPVAELIAGDDPAGIANLWRREGDEIVENPERPYLNTAQLDAIPFVSDFFSRQLDIRQYRTISEPHPFMDILTGRGCAWGRCSYCLWIHSYVKGPTYNTRSAENVIAELDWIATHLPTVKSVMLQDDTFTEDRAREISAAKIAAGNKLPFSCYARGNLSREVLDMMARAGCLNLHVGFESADAGILKHIAKGVTKDRMTRFAQDAKAAGLHLHGDFALGFPGETRETAEATIDWACQMRPHSAQFQLMIPFPGTPFYDELDQKGWIADGKPNYPELSAEELEELAKKAYRRFYISLPWLRHVLTHPAETLRRSHTYWTAFQSIFFRKYDR